MIFICKTRYLEVNLDNLDDLNTIPQKLKASKAPQECIGGRGSKTHYCTTHHQVIEGGYGSSTDGDSCESEVQSKKRKSKRWESSLLISVHSQNSQIKKVRADFSLFQFIPEQSAIHSHHGNPNLMLPNAYLGQLQPSSFHLFSNRTQTTSISSSTSPTYYD